MSKTLNHGYNVPEKGTEDWHIPLNDNFRRYDTDIEIRDREERRAEYESKSGAKFLATDTERVFVGDGSDWRALDSTGLTPTVEALEPPEGGSLRIRGRNNWNLRGSEGDLRIGDGEHRLKIGVALGGAGAGACNVQAHGGINQLGLGTAGENVLQLGEDRATFDRNVGIGGDHDSPRTRLDVRGSAGGPADSVDRHVVAVEETGSSGGGDVLALKVNDPNPNTRQNFVTFMDRDTVVGRVEGTGGGVTYESGFGDFAEFLPKADPSDRFEPGTVVGLRSGAVVPGTAGADAALVVSDRYVVLGNTPPDGEEHAHVPVALVGQVPVRVRGAVDAGDVLVPSDDDDGTASGVAPSGWDPLEHPLVVGRALEGAGGTGDGETTVTVAVGLHDLEPVAARLRAGRERVTALETTVERYRQRIDELEREIGRLRETVDGVGTETGQVRERLAALEETVTTLATDTGRNPATADD